jgi:hypothetical protein
MKATNRPRSDALSATDCIEATLTRVWIARANDSDVMIREAAVELRILVLGHVARDAVFGAHRASGRFVGLWTMPAVDGCISGCGRVTGKTHCIIKAGISRERLMWIMTGYASDSRVGPAPASTLRQPVGLEPDVERSKGFCGSHIHRRTMTGATKIYKFHRAEGSRIQNCVPPGFELFGPHRFYVPSSRTMASLASNSRSRVVRIKLPPYCRCSCVTGKTLLRSFIALRRPECAFQVLRRASGMFGCNVKTTDRWKIAELTLEEYPEVIQDEGLTFDSCTH